jgi:hypothetical protein
MVRPSKSPYKWDAALSFAGEDRPHAKALAEKLKAQGFSVFYDDDHRAHLWGRNQDVARVRPNFRKPDTHRLTDAASEKVERLGTLGKYNRRRSWVSGDLFGPDSNFRRASWPVSRIFTWWPPTSMTITVIGLSFMIANRMESVDERCFVKIDPPANDESRRPSRCHWLRQGTR